MAITIPSGRTLPLQAKTGGGYQSSFLSIVPDAAYVGDLAYDGFETANMQPESDTVGFDWKINDQTSIVTMDPDAVAVYNNGAIYNEVTDGRDWTAYEGNYCLRFRYSPGEDKAEQRWSINTPQLRIFKAFAFRIPVNFDLQGGQTKFMAIWMDGYSTSGDGSTVWMDYSATGNMSITHSLGRNTVALGYEQPVAVFDPVADRGAWFEILVEAVAETSVDADDGIMRVWIRRAGQGSYVKTHEVTNWRLRVPTGGPNGWSAGYVLGAVNAPGYAADTEWFVDNFSLGSQGIS